MNIQNKTILITGANRGIGWALVNEALRRGANRVYAGTRSGALENSDSRVKSLTLDVTNTAQIQAAVQKVESLDVLINNAGVALYDDLTDRASLEQSLAVNFFGMHGVTQAFLPILRRSKGAIVNNLSLVALAPLPIIPGYSISKAAAANMTQSLRAPSTSACCLARPRWFKSTRARRSSSWVEATSDASSCSEAPVSARLEI